MNRELAHQVSVPRANVLKIRMNNVSRRNSYEP